MNKSILRCVQLVKTFQEGRLKTPVLKNIDLTIQQGEKIAIVGASGSGKSTLLHLLGGLEKPTAGQVFWQETPLEQLSEKQLCAARNQQLGFVYQFHHLLAEFSVLENTAMPLLIAKHTMTQAKLKAEQILAKVGLAHRLHHKLSELSGGERQRTAIARALVTEPRCVLADEPTGNLDSKTAHQVYETMLQLNQELGTSLVIVTHDTQLASYMQRQYVLEDGILVEYS